MRTLNALTLVFALLSGPGAAGTVLDGIYAFLSGLSAPESVDVGCKLDPSGYCAPAPSPNVGCKLDPHGQPVCDPES